MHGNSEDPSDRVMLHEFSRTRKGKQKYTDLGTITMIHPIIVQVLPPHKPGTIKHHRPPFDSWAGVWEGIRFGFVTVFGGGSPDGFDYGGYVTDPTDDDCTPSPFYYYPNLPPYIDDQALDASPSEDSDPTGKTLPPPSTWKPDLPHALQDLTGAWEALDRGAAERLLPATGQVLVHVEGSDSYSLDARDFKDLFLDGLRNNDTASYKIESTREISPGRIQVDAEHTFKDPWGNERRIAHKYILVLEVQGCVIREFRSSTYQGAGA